MKFEQDLSELEHKAIAKLLHRLKKGSWYPSSIEELLERWSATVQEIEHGYTMFTEDYSHEMELRQLLDIVLQKVPDSIAAKLNWTIQPIDDRFMQATQESTRPLCFGNDDSASVGLWCFRVPKKLCFPTEAEADRRYADYYRYWWSRYYPVAPPFMGESSAETRE